MKMDSNNTPSTNKFNALLKGSSNVVNDISNKTNPTSKVTHKVSIDDPYSKGDDDIFDRDLIIDYPADKESNVVDTTPEIDTINNNISDSGNTKSFINDENDTSKLIPDFTSKSEEASATLNLKMNNKSEAADKNIGLENDNVDESVYKLDDEDSSVIPQGILSRLHDGYENIVDNDLFDTFSPDSKRRIMIIIGIVVLIFMLCLCAFVSQYLTGSTFFNILQTRSSSTQISTIDEDVNNAFSGIWGDLTNQIDQSKSISNSNQSNTISTSSKEQIIIKKIVKPYNERYISDIAFDGSEEFIGSFILYRQFLMTLQNYNYSSTNKTGSEFMNKYAWKEGIITTLSGSYNGAKYTVNQVLSRMPVDNAIAAIKDDSSNFNYVGCRVFELENTVTTSEGIVKLFKVVCYNSSKYKNDPNGFLISKFAKKDIFGIIDIIGRSDLDLLKDITSKALTKLD